MMLNACPGMMLDLLVMTTLATTSLLLFDGVSGTTDTLMEDPLLPTRLIELPILLTDPNNNSVPNMRVVHHATRVKRLWLQKHGWPKASGFPVTEYVACDAPRLAIERNRTSRSSTFYHYASLWSPGLPYVEFLAFFLHRRQPITAWGHAMSEWPRNPVYCVYPSGTKVLAALFALNSPRDMTEQGRKWKHRKGFATSARIYCPVPSNSDAATLMRFNTFEMDLLHRGQQLAFSFCRTTVPHVRLTACTQPLWEVGRDVRTYPNFLEDWVVFSRMSGFERLHVYDLYGDADPSSLRPLETHLAPWTKEGYVELTTRFCFSTLCSAVRKARKKLYGLGALAHDHCLFTSQLRSHWIQIVHAPHMYIVVNTTRYPKGGMLEFLEKYDVQTTAELSVRRTEIYGPKIQQNTSLMASFNDVSRSPARKC